jgi:hypothetical protein
MTDTLTKDTVIKRLKREGFQTVELIAKGGQGACFRVVKDNCNYCLKLFLYSDTAKAEYHNWDIVWRKAFYGRYIVGFH